jgi:ATP-binding cassette subfamily C protein CydD
VLTHPAVPTWPQLAPLLTAGLLAAAATWSAARWQAAGGRRIAHAMRRRLVAGLLPARERRGEPDPATAAVAIVELTDDVANYHAQTFPQRLSGPVSMAIVLLITAVVQWPAAVILLLASCLIPANMRLAGLFAQEGADERVAASTRLAAIVLDSFRGMRTLRGIGAVARRRRDLADAAAELTTTTMAVVRRAFLSGAVIDVVITFSIAANATYIGLSLLGYVRLDAAPAVTLFRGLLVLLLCPMYFQPLRAMGAAYHSRERALSAVPTISGLLSDLKSAPASGPHVPPAPAEAVTVVLDDVSFGFPGAAEPVLHDVTLTAHPGSWIAVAGPSGAGKTTLLSLIAGVRTPTRGTVRWLTTTGAAPPRVGGCAWIGQQTVLLPGSLTDTLLTAIATLLRQQPTPAVVSAVPADDYLFTGTVASNFRLADPEITEADIRRRLAEVALDHLDPQTPVGVGGRTLSGGEQRRLHIVRALATHPDVLLIDEPTTGLDSSTATTVLTAVRRRLPHAVHVMAMHRPPGNPQLPRSASVLSLD